MALYPVCHSFKIAREEGLIGPLVTQKGSTIFWNHVKASTKDERTVVHSALMFFGMYKKLYHTNIYNKRCIIKYHHIILFFSTF